MRGMLSVMDAARDLRASMTVEEYLALDEQNVRYEYVAGEVIAMSGASPRHAALAANLGGLVRQAVSAGGRPCVTFDGSLRVYVARTSSFFRPDLTIGCGELRYHPSRPPALLNPTLIIEVLSPSTQDFDLGTKFLHYQTVDPLVEVLFVFVGEPRVHRAKRIEPGKWLIEAFIGLDAVVPVDTLDSSIALRELYGNIDLVGDPTG